MYFDTFADFVDMGGHALYVWLAYSIALVIVAFNVISPILRKNQFMTEYRRRLKREKQLENRAPESSE